jgi:hypothetical protein
MKLFVILSTLFVAGIVAERQPKQATNAGAERTTAFCLPSSNTSALANALLFKSLDNHQHKITTALRHYARGMAQADKGNMIEAEKELLALKKIAADQSLKSILIWKTNSAADLVQMAYKILRAELAAKRGQFDKSISLVNDAADIEGKLTRRDRRIGSFMQGIRWGMYW